jgi:hypothetical protein
VVGGFKVGQCSRPALPRMVVCEQHATPDALRMVILAMASEIERLKQLPDTSCDNPSEPAKRKEVAMPEPPKRSASALSADTISRSSRP